MTKRSHYGNSLKDFELGDQIGHGGFAKVFKAKCLVEGHYGRCFAIKKIEKNPQIRNKIETEIAIHSKLSNHPAVVKLYTAFQDENYWYIVMELCTGGSLEKYLERKGHLSEKEAILLIKQVIEGVRFLHTRNILHRDLSLRNLLLTDSQNQIKIVDFGLAVKFNKADEKISTKVGTANFMAPEVVKRDYYSYEADCWSVGCVLYALLYGSLPFNAETKEKIQRNIKRSKLEFPDNVKISSKTKTFLESLLNKNPEERLSMQDASLHPLFLKCEKSDKINQVSSINSSSDSGMSSSSKSQHTHTSSNGPDQYKSQKEKKSKSVRSNTISQSHDNVRFCYQSPQKDKFDHAPYQDRYSKENKTNLDERNTFVKDIVPSSNTVTKNFRLIEIERKDLKVSHHKNNGDSGMSASSKSRSTHTSSIGSNQQRSLRNNNIAGSCDNLYDNTRFGYQSHQEISQKQRFDHALYQDRNSKENKTCMDERNTFIKKIVPPLNTVRKNSHRMEIEEKDLRGIFHKNNGDSGISSLSKSQSTRTYSIGLNQHRSLRNNSIAGSYDNLSDNTRFGYQSHQEIPQKQRFVHVPYQDRQKKENKNYTGVQNTVVGKCLKDVIDPLNTTRLKPLRKEIKNDFMISILNDGKVCLECLKYKKMEKYVHLFYLISHDGLMINIYKPKKKILLHPDRLPHFSLSEHQVQYFTFENLPEKEGKFNHWRNYNFAKLFVDSIRATTPKVIIYGPSAVCRMMENTPNPYYKMEFYNGKYNGFEIIEKKCKLTIKDPKGCVFTKKDWSNSMLEEFEHMKQRCIMLEKNVETYQESTFPVTLGIKPNCSKRTIIADDDKENSPPIFLQAYSVNGINSSVPVHIVTTDPEYRSTSYSSVKNTSTINTISYRSITDIIPNVQDLKIVNEWIVADYIDGIQMWLSTENDDVFFKEARTQAYLEDIPELKDRFENDSRRILRCAININKT